MKSLEGKVVIRIKANGSDRAFMSNPIKIVKVVGSHAYYISSFSPAIAILPADYCKQTDWEECDAEMVKRMNCKFEVGA